ncbi:VOC family protein [Nocardioides sp.]|uniref:VOC family protein n=1 Tax=Nocardioides sp. TaxID=35761 RepID=UPI003D0AC515
MPTREEAWPEGTPNWVEVAVDEPTAAAAYYRDLFGWVCYDAGEEEGDYILAFKDGRPAAAIGPKQVDGVPANWATYFAVDDADDAAARIRAAGGEPHFDPVDVGPNGRMFFASSPDGASFGLWEAGEHTGVGIYNEPGSLALNVLHTDDLDLAQTFYTDVFGFSYRDLSRPELVLFALLRASDGTGVAAMSTNKVAPPGTPSHWMTWFAVDNCDESAIMACRLGGRVLVEPEDTPFGRTAVVAGIEGEVFGVVDLRNTRKLVAVAD